MRRQQIKKLFSLILILTLSFVVITSVYAAGARIVNIKGKVLLKDKPTSRWQAAKLGQVLTKDYELLTKRKSECTLSLDSYNKVLTLKANSNVKIADLVTSTIQLEKGRVFAIIKKIGKGESFKIKTPTAIAGVRGTGLEVDYIDNTTSALCFEGTVYIEGLDNQGNVISEDEIWRGVGVEIQEGGEISDFFAIEEENRSEWNDFKKDVEVIIQTGPLEDVAVGSTIQKSSSQSGIGQSVGEEQQLLPVGDIPMGDWDQDPWEPPPYEPPDEPPIPIPPNPAHGDIEPVGGGPRE